MMSTMLTEEGIRHLRGHRRPLAGGLLIGAILGGFFAWYLTVPRPGDPAPVLTVEGVTTAVNGERSAIVIETDDRVPGSFQANPIQAGYGIADAQQIGDQVSPDACLPANSSGQRVRLGVVNAAPGPDGTGMAVVVWYECLSTAS
jgi:hypothetical protein